jgi:hypothetical protein
MNDDYCSKLADGNCFSIEESSWNEEVDTRHSQRIVNLNILQNFNIRRGHYDRHNNQLALKKVL